MLNTNQIITGVSLSHQNVTDITAIEPVTVTSQETVVATLLEHADVHEALVLHTCSRVEAYVVTENTDTAENALNAYLAPLTDDVTEEADWLTHEDAITHLMRVSAGLESIVTGEDHIIGQLKTARHHAKQSNGLSNDVLGPAVSKAIRVGEQARTDTQINDGIVSISSAAVQKARYFHDLADETVLIIGAGDIAIRAAKHAARYTDAVTIANRTRSNAELVLPKLPNETSATPVTLDELSGVLDDVDVVISATGSDTPVLTRDDLAGVGATTIIDIAQPADLAEDAAELFHITPVRLDDLTEITEQTRDDRAEAIEDVEHLIDTAFEELLTQYKRDRADAVVSRMRQGAAHMKREQLQHAYDRLDACDSDLSNEQREIIGDLADALVNQLLAAPTESLRDAAETDDWTTLHTAIQLFDPAENTNNDMPGELPTPEATTDPGHNATE
jgi:glutamyl-tRNA reductase